MYKICFKVNNCSKFEFHWKWFVFASKNNHYNAKASVTIAAIRARFEVPRKRAVFEACPWFWLAAQLIGAIYVNIVYHCWIYCNYRDFYRQYGKHFWWCWWLSAFLCSNTVTVTVITSLCALKKLATYCGLLWEITTLLKKPTQEKQIIQ